MNTVRLRITNPRTGLSKEIDVSNYNMRQVERTYEVYLDAGFELKIIRLGGDS